MISVIIPTKNRPDALAMCVASLVSQTRLPDELIVVDQSNTDESRRRVHELVERWPEIALRYVWDTTINGAAAARNVGVGMCKGDVILFLDDDVILYPDYVERVLYFLEQFPEVAGVGGLIMNYKPSRLNILGARVFKLGPFRDEREIFECSGRDYMQTRLLSGSNCAFRKAVLKSFSFDEALAGYSLSEDKDLTYRASREFRFVLTREARLIHNQSPVGRLDCRRLAFKRVVHLYWYFKKDIKPSLWNNLCYVWLNIGMILRSAGRLSALLGILEGYWSIIRKGAKCIDAE